jgi:hypothetical protein
MPGCLPAVHRRSASTMGVHPTPVCRPASRCPAVWCPVRPASVIWLPRPDAAVWPAGVQPASVCPSGRSRLVPRQPGSGDGDTSARRGSGHAWIESSCMWSDPVLQRLGRPPEEAWVRAPLRRSCGGRRGSVGRGPGRVVLGEAAPDRPGGPDHFEGRAVAGDGARAGGWLARCCRMPPCGPAIRAWSRDYSTWS